MKTLLTLLLLLTGTACYAQTASAQNLSLGQLNKLRAMAPMQADDYLAAKGWKFSGRKDNSYDYTIELLGRWHFGNNTGYPIFALYKDQTKTRASYLTTSRKVYEGLRASILRLQLSTKENKNHNEYCLETSFYNRTIQYNVGVCRESSGPTVYKIEIQ